MGRLIQALGVLALLLASAGAHAKEPAALTYRLTPITEGGSARLKVKLEFAGDADGSTALRLPHKWASVDDYEKGISGLRVTTKDTSLTKASSSFEYTVTHPPSATLSVEYEVEEFREGPILAQGDYFKPVVRDTYLHFIGHGVFIVPTWDGEQARPVRLIWEKIPETWSLANSFGAEQADQQLMISTNRLRHAVYVAGDFEVSRVEIRGKPVYVAMRGEWKFADGDFRKLASKIVRTQRDFWNDHDFPYFLITLLQTEEARCCSRGGTGLSNSFAMAADRHAPSVETFRYLLSHELFHTWNGRKIRRESPEQLVYWFSEGFTDYYTRLLNLRAGLTDLETYVDGYNRIIRRYYLSPVRNAGHQRVLEEFWTDRNVSKLPYQRGSILAHNWNAQIKAGSEKHSLDDMMRDLLQEAQASGTVVSAKSVDHLIKPYLADGVAADIERFIEKGETTKPVASALGPCVSQETKTFSTFDLGFDYPEDPKEGAIEVKGVRRDSSAWHAGLRDEMRLVSRSIHWNEPDTKVELGVVDGDGKRRSIEYFPRGDAVEIPQYVVNKERLAKKPKQCLSWFGVGTETKASTSGKDTAETP